MKTNSMKLISLSVLALIFSLGVANEAEARIRARATRRAPVVKVRVDAGAIRYGRGHRQALPGRYHEEYRVTRRDRKIAHRLARFTGVPKRELIQLKRQGYGWNEIGRWLNVSPKVVRAAKSQKKWQRFLDRRGRRCYSEVGGY